MTPELLAMLTPEEAKAWALCESCGPCADMGDDGTYAGEVRRCSDFALVHQDCDDSNARKFIAEASVALPAALTTIATLRAELRAVADLIQEVGVLGIASTMDAVVVSGQPSARDLLTWAAKAMDAWPKERQTLRAEVATLRETLAEQQRAFVIGLDLAQRTADAEIAELRARLTTGIGLPLGVNDCDGNPVHVGDTLAFDGREWTRTYGAPDHIYTVEYSGGQVLVDGTIGDIRHYCRVVKRWDEKAADDAVRGAT